LTGVVDEFVDRLAVLAIDGMLLMRTVMTAVVDVRIN